MKDLVKNTNNGTCRVCNKAVQWSRAKVSSHKRSNCPVVTAEEKILFRKRPLEDSMENDSNTSINANPYETNDYAASGGTSKTKNQPITHEKKAKIDAALGRLFFRTGIPFRILDSEAFRQFVEEINPEYAEVMPKSRTLPGTLLEKEYEPCWLSFRNSISF